MNLDKRYSVERHYCGYEQTMYCGCFCGERVTPYTKDKRQAKAMLESFANERLAALEATQ